MHNCLKLLKDMDVQHKAHAHHCVCSPAAGYSLHWGDPDPEVSRELLQGFRFCPSAPTLVSPRAVSAMLSGGWYLCRAQTAAKQTGKQCLVDSLLHLVLGLGL